MKKPFKTPLIILFFVALCFSMFFMSQKFLFLVKAFGGGDGTPGNPYQVTDCVDLQAISTGAEPYTLDASYIVTSDFSCAAVTEWDPIGGSPAAPFTGSFDGDGHTISNFTNLGSIEYNGVFGAMLGGTIKDLTITGINFPPEGWGWVGGLVGRIDSDIDNPAIIDNVHVSGSVTGGFFTGGLIGGIYGTYTSVTNSSANVTVTGWENVGGLVGISESPITTSEASGNVTGYARTGGLIGTISNEVTDSHSTGIVTGVDDTGGFVGYIEDNVLSAIDNCYAQGNVNAGYIDDPEDTKGNSAGGLVGFSRGTISNSYATGNVININPTSNDGFGMGGLVGTETWTDISYSYATGTVDGYWSVGGLVGHADNGTITKSYATGAVGSIITTAKRVGGLVGTSMATVSNSYAMGNVTGDEDVGGFAGGAGWGDKTITYSYSKGLVTGNTLVGGFVGNSNGPVTTSYYDRETSGMSDFLNADPRTTAEMKTQATYVGWDFADIWDIDAGTNGGYPTLTISGAPAASDIATVTSVTYTVSAGGTANETITNIPFNTPKATFLAALAEGQADQTWNTADISDPVLTGDTLVVTAEDAVTVVTYTTTVDAEPSSADPVLIDIYPGDSSSRPDELTNVNGTLFFQADDGANGVELWKSDGTTTEMVEDIYAGATGSYPTLLTEVNGILYFMADDGTGNGLWISDGTALGTTLVKHINDFSYPVEVSNELFFWGEDVTNGKELWKSNGTEGGTGLVKDITAGATGTSAGGHDATVLGGTYFFIDNYFSNPTEDLWKSDGTLGGTVLLKSFDSAAGIYAFDGAVYFMADDGLGAGAELWKSDGTTTQMVKDINTNAGEGSSPSPFVKMGGSLYFWATMPDWSTELWKTDGTTLGTVYADVTTTYDMDGSTDPISMGDYIYFLASDSGWVYETELWRTDGTEGGAEMVKDIHPTDSSNIEYLTVMGDTLYFSADDGADDGNQELWKSDGTDAGTVMVADLAAPDWYGSYPESLTDIAGKLFFSADTELNGTELYVYNPSAGPALSNDATVTSSTYTVSPGNTTNETITNVPEGTSKATFLAALTKGQTDQTWVDTGIDATVVPGNTLVVTAEDGTTVVTYTISTSVVSDIVAWWTFDSTDTLNDSSNSNLDGDNVGGFTTGISSQTGSVTNVFNEASYFAVPDASGILDFSGNESEFTVEAWVKPSAIIENDTNYTIITKLNEAEDEPLWSIQLLGTPKTIRVTLNTSDGLVWFDTVGQLTLNAWNKITFAISNADQTYTVRIGDAAPEVQPFFKVFNLPDSTGDLNVGAFTNGTSPFLGEIDNIKIWNHADAKAPQVLIQALQNPERVTNPNQEFDVVVTDETGIEDIEYLFLEYKFGWGLDLKNWQPVESLTSGSWGDEEITFSLTAPNLTDSDWYLYIRATDSNNFKHIYTDEGWFTYVGFTTPSAMPYYHFMIEAIDTTPPLIFANTIVPNPTVDKNPGVRGYIKDYETLGTGDTASNIDSIEYRLTHNAVVGNWIDVPPLDGELSYDSAFEEFYFQFENLELGDYDLEIRTSDVSGNSTEDDSSNYTETFTVYEPAVEPTISIIEKEEDFNNHQFHDVLFSDGVWGNGILRLRQEIDFSQETALFTNNNDFGYKFGSATVGTFDSIDGNLWIVTNDHTLFYYNIANGTYAKYPRIGDTTVPLENIKEFEYGSNRYLLLNFGGQATYIYNINNTPMNIADDTSANYMDKTSFATYGSFVTFGIDTRNNKFAYYATVKVDNGQADAQWLVWIDTKGTIMNLEDDTYTIWGAEDDLFFDDDDIGHTATDFTATYFDQASNLVVMASYVHGIYEFTDGGTPENKLNASCRRLISPSPEMAVFSIIEDTNGYYWTGGPGLGRINTQGTISASDDVFTKVLTEEDLGLQAISQLIWVPGDYPVGDEIWIMTRDGYIRALEFNFTYDDALDDTQYLYRMENIDNRSGGMSTFAITDRNTIYTTLQGYGVQKIDLTRSFADTNVIEMLPIPPDGILAINYIDLEEVLGSVTQGSPYSLGDLVSYEVSNDSGVTWFPITEGQRVEFPTADYKLKLRINLNKGSSPIIDFIKLSYVTYPNQEENQCDINMEDKAPVITSIQPLGTGSMKVNFTGITDEPTVQHYILEYGLSNTVFQYAPIFLGPTATSYTVSGLNLNTQYYFRVLAASDCAQSAWSNVLSATDNGQPLQPPVVPDPTPVSCGQACTIDSDCGDTNNVCNAGKCELQASACTLTESLDANKCACIREDSPVGGLCGQACTSDFQCTEENNKCLGGTCKLASCPAGTKLTSNACGCVSIGSVIGTGIFQAIFNFISNTIASVIEFLRSIPITPKTAQTVTDIGLLTVITTSLTSLAVGASYPSAYVLQAVAYAFGIVKLKRKSRDYGMVYDSVTKEPLERAIVRIFDINDNLVATEVTDIYGIFETNIKENGQYRIEVLARDFEFPTKVVVGSTDGIYEKIYRGDVFNFDTNDAVNFSIPVDPYDRNVPEYSKARFRNAIYTFLNNLQNVLVILGFGFSLIAYSKTPSGWNLFVLLAYLVFLLINLVILLQGRHKYGLVTDITETPKTGVAIGLRETEFNKMFGQRITNENGKYRFIVPGGEYKLEVIDPAYEAAYDTSLYVEGKPNKVLVVKKDLRVKRKI